jgi:hypothetical protein
MTPQTVLAALALFQLKHLVADFFLQSPRMVADKGRYGRPGGLAHAGIHALATLPVLSWLAVGPRMLLMILLAEFLVHYHIDWAKARHAARSRLTSDRWLFWATLGGDQALHQLTYLGILWWIMA